VVTPRLTPSYRALNEDERMKSIYSKFNNDNQKRAVSEPSVKLGYKKLKLLKKLGL
jgi:hypothetical protein